MIAQNFPAQSTPFIGRTDELAKITALLSKPECRLLTLVGPGGIGKTRLALEITAAQSSHFQDGIYVVLLQPIASSEQLVSAIADALQFQFFAPTDLKQQLLSYLRTKSLLLVLDNCEHLLDGISLVSDILASAPHVKVLTTSRERLNLLEEWVYAVSGLEAASAIQLFLQTARRVGYVPQEADTAAIVHVCQLVEGMPLAIELAAAWVRVMPCAEITHEIEGSLDILATTTRNMPEKHRSMHAVFEHSWIRLTDAEQAVFRKLSVFRGGFTREAAEQVAGANLAILALLVDKSLLRVNASGRYSLQELLRQYAQEKLTESPLEYEQTYDFHCAFYADFMGQWADEPFRITQNETRASIVENLANVRAAFQRAADTHKQNEMGKFLQTLTHFYDLQDQYQEGLDAVRLAADSLRESFDETDEYQAKLLGLSLAWQAWFLNYLLQTDEARRLAHNSLALLLPYGDGREIVYTYIFLCQLADNAAQRKLFAVEAMRHAQATDFAWGINGSSHMLSWAARELGEYDQALFMLQEALALCRQCADRWGETWSLMHLSWVACDQQDLTKAKRWAQEALSIAELSGYRLAMSIHHNMLGELAFKSDNYAEAALHYQQGLVIAEELGNWKHIAYSHSDLGQLALRLGDTHKAREHFYKTLRIAQNIHHLDLIPTILVLIAELMETEGNFERAVELIAYPLQHPKSDFETRQRAGHLRDKLETRLPTKVYATVWEGAAKLELDTVVAGLLNELNQPSSPPARVVAPKTIASFTEPFSERELEILRLIADGLSNREIADQLVLALSTVKWYINELYSKLAVSNRAQAIERARELNLLAD